MVWGGGGRGADAAAQRGGAQHPPGWKRVRPERPSRYHSARRGSTRASHAAGDAQAAGLRARRLQEPARATELEIPARGPVAWWPLPPASDQRGRGQVSAGPEQLSPVPRKPAESPPQPRNENKSPSTRMSSNGAG